MVDRGAKRFLPRERGRAIAFLGAWILSLAFVWSLVSATVPVPVSPGTLHSVALEIHGDAWTVNYEARSANATVFALLVEASVTLGFELDYVEYGWPYNDVFVTSINGTRNDQTPNLWWQYCVNGEYAAKGAATQELRDGDFVLWVYAPPGGGELCR